MILLDSSVLVDHFRTKNKQASFFYQLVNKESDFNISTVTKYEILIGSKEATNDFWEHFFSSFQIIPFDNKSADKAIEIYRSLKFNNKLISLADILIAATALAYQFPLAILNVKHFERIPGLLLLKK